jgi:hypothetical protein
MEHPPQRPGKATSNAQELKLTFLSVVISPFHFLNGREELLFEQPVMFHRTFFGKGPVPFNSADADCSQLEFVFMINTEMTITTEHKRITAFPGTGTDN